jgi:membrane-associated phospholipid phosphatase
MTASERIATWISTVLNPFFLAPVLFIMLARQHSVSLYETSLIISVAVLFYTLLPLFILFGFKRRKLIINYDVPVRSNRNKPFILGLCSYAAGLAIYLTLPFESAWIYAAISAMMLANGVLSALINLQWKISIHSNGIASFSAGLLYLVTYGYLDPVPGYPVIAVIILFLLTAAVVWSRIVLGAHTPAQAVAGAVLGIVLTTGLMWFFLVS